MDWNCDHNSLWVEIKFRGKNGLFLYFLFFFLAHVSILAKHHVGCPLSFINSASYNRMKFWPFEVVVDLTYLIQIKKKASVVSEAGSAPVEGKPTKHWPFGLNLDTFVIVEHLKYVCVSSIVQSDLLYGQCLRTGKSLEWFNWPKFKFDWFFNAHKSWRTSSVHENILGFSLL